MQKQNRILVTVPQNEEVAKTAWAVVAAMAAKAKQLSTTDMAEESNLPVYQLTEFYESLEYSLRKFGKPTNEEIAKVWSEPTAGAFTQLDKVAEHIAEVANESPGVFLLFSDILAEYNQQGKEDIDKMNLYDAYLNQFQHGTGIKTNAENNAAAIALCAALLRFVMESDKATGEASEKGIYKGLQYDIHLDVKMGGGRYYIAIPDGHLTTFLGEHSEEVDADGPEIIFPKLGLPFNFYEKTDGGQIVGGEFFWTAGELKGKDEQIQFAKSEVFRGINSLVVEKGGQNA